MASTMTARQMARAISAKVGRPVDAKRVRAWVRDNVDAYDDDRYTAHAYDARLQRRIMAAFVTSAKSGRSRAASTGRGTKSGATKHPAGTGTRKAGRTLGTGPVQRAPSAPQTAQEAPSDAS